jgi:hypothetical protein
MLMCLLILAGCETGPKPPALVPVTGKVELDGRPLAKAVVTFLPTGMTPGVGSEATTNDAGEYKLRFRRGGDGAAVGTYKVTISKRLMPDGSEPVFDKNSDPATSPARESLPPRYNAVSTLTATVPEGGGTSDFSLQSKMK